jgi:uncharacterized protein YegP (UPF0339 family)
MADVRFSILCGPPSLDPSAIGFRPQQSIPARVPTVQAIVRTEHGRTEPPRRRRRADEPIGGWYAWRLMASNNRTLASSFTTFPSRVLAVAAIRELQRSLASVQAQVVTEPNSGTWRWRAEIGGVTVAVGPHWYERERDCRAGFAKFATAVAHAQLAEGGTVLPDHRVTVPRRRPADIGSPRPWPTY